MKISRVCAGLAVGGLVTFGAMGVAGASVPTTSLEPAVNIGGNTNGNGGVVQALPTPYTTTVVKATVPGVVTAQVGGPTCTTSNHDLNSLLQDPTPLNVCVLCHPVNQES